MKNFEGYLKRKFGDSYVLLAGGGEKLLSSFAFRNTWNDLLNNTNEFTFASSLYSGAIWMNYRTASGSTDGAITQYLFGDGAGSYADVVAKGFKVNGADDTSVVLAGGSTKSLNEFLSNNFLKSYYYPIGGVNHFSNSITIGMNSRDLENNGYVFNHTAGTDGTKRIYDMHFDGYSGPWTVSFYIKASTAVDASLDMCDTGNSIVWGEQSFSISTEYVFHKFTFTNADRYNVPGVYNGFLDLNIPGNLTNTYYIKNIKIEKGFVATDWCLSPWDVANGIGPEGMTTKVDILKTARTLTIGNSGKSFDGSANVAWTLTEIGIPSWAQATNIPTLDSISDGSTRKLSDYVTLTTNQSISGVKTFSNGSWKLYGTEAGNDNIVSAGILNLYKANGTDLVHSSARVTNAIKFNWYNDAWYLGHVRGGDTNTTDFVIALLSYDDTKLIEKLRINIDGTGYLGSQKLVVNGSTPTFGRNITIKTTSVCLYPTLYFHEYYDGTNDWVGYIATDYYGASLCSTEGYTHGMYFKTGRSGYTRFVYLNGDSTPVAKLESNMFTMYNGSITANSFVKVGGTAAQFLKADGSVDTNTYSTTGHDHDGRYLRDIVLNGTFSDNVIPTNLPAGLHRIHRPGTDYVSVLCGYDYPGDYWLLFFQTSSWIPSTIQYRATNCTDWITLLTSLNSSVSGGGSTWGSSITVKINGTEITLSIPSNPNTWRDITDDYTGESSTISLSLKGGKSIYDALLNGYASWAGGLSSVLPQLAASGEANEVVFSRDLCNGTESSIGYFEKGIRFRWYSNYINIGNVRGGSSNLYGFCIAYSTTATGNYNVLTRVTTNGDYYVTGNTYSVNFYTTSDQRKKDNIIPISESIRSFTLKDSNTKSYGFIAQELEKTNPELVDFSGEYKTVNYNGAICLVIAKLENRIKELENEVTLLRKGGKYETI